MMIDNSIICIIGGQLSSFARRPHEGKLGTYKQHLSNDHVEELQIDHISLGDFRKHRRKWLWHCDL